MAYEDDKREFQRITARSAVLRDRGFFSLASSVVVFLLSRLADSFGYYWLMVLLFLGAVGLVLVGLYFVLQEKRLRWRYYNLHYRVQAEHENGGRGGFIGRDRKW